MNESRARGKELNRWLWLSLLPAAQLVAVAASAACPTGQSELRPNVRALPPRDIAMAADGVNMRFSTTSWNSGLGKLELVPRNPEFDPTTGQTKQPVDQRIYCSGGGFYDRSAGSAEYHPAHNHVHYNDYANYILEQDTSSPQSPRKGVKTTFCIMDTTGVNTQISGAAGASVFSLCPTQDPDFNKQGMSVGWGDTYGYTLAGQSLYVADLTPGMYRLRHVFDPKDTLLETTNGDNESCRKIEIGDGSNGRYVADRGPCAALPTPRVDSVTPAQAKHNSCVNMTINGANLAPELKINFTGGTGPLPAAKNLKFDTAGNYIQATVCVPKAKGSKNNPQLGSDPVWDVLVSATFGGYPAVTNANLFRVTK